MKLFKKIYRLRAVITILTLGACVDRLDFSVDETNDFSVVVEGFISDQKGPYQITINKSFDIQSLYSLKAPLSVKRLTISDNRGASEELKPVAVGVYQTDSAGIQGKIGNVYSLKVELLDGRTYESSPDTLSPSGSVDSIYFKQITYKNSDDVIKPGFDVFFNASNGENVNRHYLWKFIGTYQIDTNPELFDTLCVEARCPKPKLCSGYRYVGGELLQIEDCTCCTCWVSFFDNRLILNENRLSSKTNLNSVNAGLVPINQWTFMHKVRVEVQQRSLSLKAHLFFKSIRDQMEGINSLFQPISGKIPTNFIQTEGKAERLEGFFYATSINSKSIYITPGDVHPSTLIPVDEVIFNNDCRKAFPYSTIKKPDFWN